MSDEEYKRTGVYVTEEELAEIHALAETARNTPVMAISSQHALRDGGFSGQAWKRARDRLNEIAIKHGLPPASYNYGITPEGEIITP